ncbi:MAG: aminotransferase class I/II-fold pyridoxal phosphate-dependent enzyme [Chitinophagaceae bacterium]|nr:aminotransferase class I/II-fold pyridoxal phosphate-dependent enzyme [Chitinophagaceae bacterium]
MPDFTSSLYLGMHHSAAELEQLQQLTTGVPAALYETRSAKKLASGVAAMQRLDEGLTMPSTLHIYHDLYVLLAQCNVVVFVDKEVYPVSKYGIEKLYLSKKTIYYFNHNDAASLDELIKKHTGNALPVIITDGWCTYCGKPAPLNMYIEILRPYNGYLIVDDTQAFGVLGTTTGKNTYGKGGGGILQWLNTGKKNIVSITSLAKAFGVPLAVISGDKIFLDAYKMNSETMLYSSPVSTAHLIAGLHALDINKRDGSTKRNKLLKNVLLARHLLKIAGVFINGGIFPVQSIPFKRRTDAEFTHRFLKRNKIETVLTEGHSKIPSVTFVITCNHSVIDIQRLCNYIEKVLGKTILHHLSPASIHQGL